MHCSNMVSACVFLTFHFEHKACHKFCLFTLLLRMRQPQESISDSQLKGSLRVRGATHLSFKLLCSMLNFVSPPSTFLVKVESV